ncbi:hypothetical protein [Streptomyces sp. GESEQ-35]|uniref:hypothetical protein n=1 Tax=Streptomyces sp. GESEQ-35 TaxID=2812657 RepID=UPI0027E3988F|nr:hypothetical protein [Streptomyces sp. GESEQ-35]
MTRLDLRLFLKPAFSGVMAGALAFNAAAFGVMVYTSIWLQTLLGMSPVRGCCTACRRGSPSGRATAGALTPGLILVGVGTGLVSPGIAGGGAGALYGAFPGHTLHEGFAEVLNSAAGVAGCAAMAAGVLVLALVRTPGGVTNTPAPTLTEEQAAHRS